LSTYEGTIAGIVPPVAGCDYLAGEFNVIDGGRVCCSPGDPRNPVTWMPEEAYVKGTDCLHHVLFCLDGFWHCWSPWEPFLAQSSVFRRHPLHFSRKWMNGLREKGEFPDPVFAKDELTAFMRDFTGAGGAVTVNVGITPEGRLNPKSTAWLRAVREPAGTIRWKCKATAADGSLDVRGKCVYAYAGHAARVRGTEFAEMKPGRAVGANLAASEDVHVTRDAFVPSSEENGLQPGVGDLLRGGAYLDARPARWCPVTLKGLVPGRKYLAQVWLADMRPCGFVRSTFVDGAVHLWHRAASAPFGMTAIAEFTADAAERIVNIVPPGPSFQLNAIQVRALDDAQAIPAPPRAAWTKGTFGLNANPGATAAAILQDLERSGAGWMTVSIDAGVDFSGLADSVHARGRRFVLDAPGHTGVVERVKDLSLELGDRLDGWIFRDMDASCYPYGLDIGLWTAAGRAGSPSRALFFEGAERFSDGGQPLKTVKGVSAVADESASPNLRDTRLLGTVGSKTDRFLSKRVFSDYARNTMFPEAEKAFDTHFDDDPSHPGAGYWQGEYWGKEMLGLIEGAVYGHDGGLKAWALERARELIRRHQRPDGYLGTYRDPEYLCYRRGWNWNLWGRKYTLWALLEIYEATGEQDILAAAKKLMDQQIEMLHRLKLPIWETGCYVGLPSMSVLKPLLVLYRHAPEERYLAYAREIVDGWRRKGNPAPNLLVNAFSERPVADWYGVPHEWAKAYEFMSCLEGLVEYYRVTGETRVLEAVERIWDKLARDEANPVGTVAYFDHFFNAARMTNGASEPCDSTHWIRVSRELFLVTGNTKYLDAMERTFLNGFLAGVWRDGSWGAHMVRSHGRRHRAAPVQVGMKHTQCCVANIPRTFFDVARTAVTRTADGTVSVNLFTDSETAFADGVRVAVSGNYPVSDEFTVSVRAEKPVRVRFRVPDWCPSYKVDGKRAWMLEAKVAGGWHVETNVTSRAFKVALAMPPHVVSFDRVPYVACESEWAGRFWISQWENPEEKPYFRTKPAARVERGPLVLAKTKALGCTDAEIFDFASVNGRGFAATLAPVASEKAWGAWRLTLVNGDGEKVETTVGDFQSAADLDDPDNAFSVWF
ncbi:MAG: glycoside hydrolase family 127 protein, partial [Kiritimatiellae bacterium]|nr:glycoside hydrolase family 127 protein [Kiritimatiellia bacterium]